MIYTVTLFGLLYIISLLFYELLALALAFIAPNTVAHYGLMCELRLRQ